MVDDCCCQARKAENTDTRKNYADIMRLLMAAELWRKLFPPSSPGLEGPRSRSSQDVNPIQKGLEVCYCLWGCLPDPRLGPILGPSRSHPGSEGVLSRFSMCLVLQRFGTLQVTKWGPSRPIVVASSSVPSRIGPGRAETDFLATSDPPCS